MPSESRLAEIYRQELKNKGLISALISASAERRKERNDIRRMLPQSGVMGAAFQHAFGKPYRYGSSGSGVRDTRGPSDVATSKSVEEKITRLGVDMKIMAKNSVVLPAMARDMNLMRMNMQKMVKLSGGTPSMKADMFFKRAADRESSYESQYGRGGGTNPLSPSSGKTGGGIGSFFGGIFSLLGGALSGAGSILSALIPSISGFFGALIKAIVAAGVIGLALSQLSPETREALKKFFVDALAGFFNAVRDGFKYIKDLMTDPKVVESFQGAIQELVGAIVAAFKLALSTPIKTPLGEYTLGGILATTVIALAAFKGAVFAATTALLGMGGGRGGALPGGAGGSNSGGGRGGWLGKFVKGGVAIAGVSLLTEGVKYYMQQGESEESARILAQEDINLAQQQQQIQQQNNPSGVRGSEVVDSVGGAINSAIVLGTGISMFPSVGGTPTTSPPTFQSSAGKKLTDFGSIGERREAVKNRPQHEKIARLIKKIGEKIGVRALTGFIWSRLKWSIATKLSAVVAGVVAAPFSAGVSLVISAIGAGLLAYDLYVILDFLTTLAKEVGVDEGESSSPQRVETQAATDVTPPPAPAPVPAPVPAAAPGGTGQSNTSPVPVNAQTGTNVAQNAPPTGQTTFAQLTKQQQDRVLAAQAEFEHGKGRPIRHNNPGNIMFGDYAKKFGAVPSNQTNPHGTIALFPSMEAGIQAQRELWNRIPPSPQNPEKLAYKDMPLDKAIAIWGGAGAAHKMADPQKYLVGIQNYQKHVIAAAGGSYTPPVMVAAAPSGASNVPASAPGSGSNTASSTKPTETPIFAGTGNALMDIFAGYLTYREEYMKKTGAPAQIAINSGNSTVNQGGGGGGGQQVSPYNNDMMSYLLRPIT
jgi:hypothetical protein